MQNGDLIRYIFFFRRIYTLRESLASNVFSGEVEAQLTLGTTVEDCSSLVEAAIWAMQTI